MRIFSAIVRRVPWTCGPMSSAPVRPLRVLYLGRVFSGLRRSFETGSWTPAGVPAVFKLLETLQSDPSVELKSLFFEKNAPNGTAGRSEVLRFSAAGQIIWHCSPRPRWIAWRPLAGLLAELMDCIRVLYLVISWRPDVIYSTNACIPQAAMVARLRLTPVVLRFLGVHPVQDATARRAGPMRWLYRSRFSLVICTRDGSNAPDVLRRLLRPGQQVIHMLNGVDPIEDVPAQAVQQIRADLLSGGRSFILLFVGRLERQKGIIDFLETVRLLEQMSPGMVLPVVIGDGSIGPQSGLAEEWQSLPVIWLGAVPHREVVQHLLAADLFVSLNYLGNLSNVVLEACRAGVAMAILEPDPETGSDADTHEIIPVDSAFRISRNGPAKSLADIVSGCLREPSVGLQMRKKSYKRGAQFSTWADRLAFEVDALHRIGSRNVR